MSATVTIGTVQPGDPAVFPCQVSVDGRAAQAVGVVVSHATLTAVGEEQQTPYIHARAMLTLGDATDATATVTPYAEGTSGPPDTRNWAALWLAGNIPS